MSALSVLIIIIGIWVLINGLNGNLPGLVQGTVKFNTPGSSNNASK